jgi:hypothetical protein
MHDETATAFAAVAVGLHERGWRPHPVHGKKPEMLGWNGLCGLEWDRDDLLATIGDYADAVYGCGLVAPRTNVFLDIDILDARLAAAVSELADRILGPTPLVRVGLAPKQVRIYRCDPVDLIRTQKLHPIEIFCGSGQIAAFGIHPDTNEPYRWIAGHSPLTMAADDPSIPQIRSAQLRAFVTEARALLRREHYFPPARRPGARIGTRHGASPLGLHDQLRRDAARLGFRRAAIALLESAVDGSHLRHNTMWAVVSAAAGRGWSEEQVVQMFERHFAGRDGVSADAFQRALDTCFRRRTTQ